MTFNIVRKKAFWLVSRTALAVYSRFPIFGPLRAAVGIMRNNDSFLAIERNDGRGLSFPGGLAFPWETAEQAVIREIREETGMKVTKSFLKSRYYSCADIPVYLSVFEVEADGQLRGSWEGMPRWLGVAELRQRVVPSQRRIVETIE